MVVELLGVHIHRMAADGPYDGDAERSQRIAEVGRAADAVVEVVRLEYLGEALRNGLHVPPT